VVAAFYIVLICLFLFVMLFGECSFFEGTVVSRAHACLTGGLCEAGSDAVERYCGERGKRCVATTTTQCCDRPNPALQVRACVGCKKSARVCGCAFSGLTRLGAVRVHRARHRRLLRLPARRRAAAARPIRLRSAPVRGPRLLRSSLRLSRAYDRSWTGPAAVTSGLVTFLLTCFSDPGTVHAGNVDRHLESFAYDGMLYAPRRCPTMRLQAPARSKFCRVTNRRVARFDHYCAWMGNSVGENNYRYFLSFLLWHVVLCAYGATLMLSIIAGEARLCRVRGAFRLLRG
jgi:palmitoyltransferase